MFDPALVRKQAAAQGLKASTVTSDAGVRALGTYETFRGSHNKAQKSMVLGGGLAQRSTIDISWLEAASETFAISADPKDYVVVSVPSVTCCVPNRNMQAFPFEEVSYHDPMMGMLVYKTFVGKATNIDHINSNPLDAKGVIFDAALVEVPEYGVWKILTLAGFDRTKDKDLVNDLISGKRDGYSMGAVAQAFVCSICGCIDTNIKPCKHLDSKQGGAKGSLWGSKNQRISPQQAHGSVEKVSLAYQLVMGVNYFELSSVGDPADSSAVVPSSSVWML